MFNTNSGYFSGMNNHHLFLEHWGCMHTHNRFRPLTVVSMLTVEFEAFGVVSIHFCDVC
jgi:hypothetical protein